MNGIKNADMKSWMSSAFGTTEPDTKKFKTTRSSSKNVSKKTTVMPEHATQSGYRNRLLLAEKYAPKNRTELVVNKAKVEQLSGILDLVINKPKGSIIIMEGPPGCGKQATLEILCKEKNIEVVQWSQPNTSLGRFDNNNDMDYTEDPESNDWRNNPYESQSKVFANFLFKTSRYSSQIFCDENQSSKKIIFFKEIPLFAFKDAKGFQKILSNFLVYSKSPMVFSFSNSLGVSKEFNPIKIFTVDFRNELGFFEVAFNPIANTYVSKHLENIMKREAGFKENSDKNFINEVCLISDGDLRQALNILELAQYNPKLRAESISSSKRPTAEAKTSSRAAKTAGKQKYTTRQEPSQHTMVQKKDSNFSLFRGLGKVLHRKNMDTDVPENNSFTNIEAQLPDCLKYKGLQRPPLFYDPDDILAKTPIGEELITLYLHQNYLELFALKSVSLSFDDSFQRLDNICENFMLADMINKSYSNSASDYNYKAKDTTGLLSIRSLLFHTYIPDESKQSTKTNNGKGLWMPLHKPYVFRMLELRKKKKETAYDMLLDNNDAQNVQLACYLIEMQNEFFTTILPYAAMKKRSRGQLQQLGAFNRGQFRTGQAVTLSNENDPSFFMDDQDGGEQVDVIKTAGKCSKNLYKYESDDGLNIRE